MSHEGMKLLLACALCAVAAGGAVTAGWRVGLPAAVIEEKLVVLSSAAPSSLDAVGARDPLLEQLRLDFAAVAANRRNMQAMDGQPTTEQGAHISGICSAIPRPGSELAQRAEWVERAAMQLQLSVPEYNRQMAELTAVFQLKRQAQDGRSAAKPNPPPQLAELKPAAGHRFSKLPLALPNSTMLVAKQAQYLRAKQRTQQWLDTLVVDSTDLIAHRVRIIIGQPFLHTFKICLAVLKKEQAC